MRLGLTSKRIYFQTSNIYP